MKDITRIHLAQVAYDIEKNAKKALEEYTTNLEANAGDAEVLNDIEIRITELLADQSVQAGGVITQKNVEAIKKQLGDPAEFASDDPTPNTAASSEIPRKLYRDGDGALVGGLLSGLAYYTKTNVVVLRIVFVMFMLISFGFAILLYALICLLTPKAITAAQKLEMRGVKPTATALKSFNQQESLRKNVIARTDDIRRNIFTVVGALFLAGSLGTVAFTAVVGVGVATEANANFLADQPYAWPYILAFGLMVISGLLLALLIAHVAYACFRFSITRRLAISAAIVTVAGIVCSVSSVSIVGYQTWAQRTAIEQSVTSNDYDLPKNFSGIKTLKINAPGINIKYSAHQSQAKATLLSTPKNSTPNVTVSGTTATIHISKDDDNEYVSTLSITGPQLSNIEVQSDNFTYASNQSAAVSITANNQAFVAVQGNFNVVNTHQTHSSVIDLNQAAVTSVAATIKDSASLHAGNVRSASITHPTVCANGNKARVSIASTQQPIKVNGQDYSKTSPETCLIIRQDEAGE